MNWENCEETFEEEILSGKPDSTTFKTENLDKEESKALQLLKFQDPAQNPERRKYIDLITLYGDFLAQQNYHDIINTLCNKDADIFIFNMARKDPVQYYFLRNDLKSLHPGIKILERRVRETMVDVEKRTLIQISTCHLYYEDINTEGDEITCEIFSINDNRISKYRLSFGVIRPSHGPGDPLEHTRRDIMLAKVKEMNYAFADQPDLEKIASLLHERTEYKIWSWDSEKSFLFRKDNFAAEWRNMEENFTIKCIVPYEIYSEREYIIGSYVYHLESKDVFHRKYLWLTTCIYAFDRDINITQMSQQGELHPEDEVVIPFEVFTRDKLRQKLDDVFVIDVESFNHSNVQYHCDIYRFGPYESPHLGLFRGLKEINKLSQIIVTGEVQFEWLKTVDTFVDFHHPSYEIVVALTCANGTLNVDCPIKDKPMDFVSMSILAFENGKLAKVYQFFSGISKPVPSPFDDLEFESNYVKRKEIIE